MKLAQRFAQLRVSQEEFVLLRAMILLNAGESSTRQATFQTLPLEQYLMQCFDFLFSVDNADVFDATSANSSRLIDLQRQMEHALHYTVVKRQHKDISYLSQLLMLLPHIKQTGIESVKHITQAWSKQMVSVGLLDLLKEMLQATGMSPSSNTVTSANQ